MFEFRCEVTEFEGEPCLVLKGSCRDVEAERLGREIEQASERAATKVFLDLSGVRLLDSASLGVLVFHHNRLKAKGLRAILLDPSPTCRHLLEITSLHRVLEIRSH